MLSRDVMYRSSPETKKQTNDSFANLLSLNAMHMKCFQEMYLETCSGGSSTSSLSNGTSSPSISPTTSNSSGHSLLSPISLSPSSTVSNISSSSSLPANRASYRSSNPPPGLSGVSNHHSSSGNLLGSHLGLLQQQQQQLLNAAHQHQQHLAALAAATAVNNLTSSNMVPNYSNGGVAANSTMQQQQHDEISKSLKMFAMLTAYGNGNDSFNVTNTQLPQSPVEAAMQDFASNGYICDELNRYQLGMHLSNSAAGGYGGAAGFHQHLPTNNHPTLTKQQQQQLQQHNLNINFNNNFYKMLPSYVQQSQAVNAAAAAAAVTAAATANMDYNCNQKKLQKRYNPPKNDKYSSAKHCVFCENNNEPEAVVKSHAVRDSFGRVLCPKLRTYICPICKASGDNAHTVKYCPQKPIITMEDAIKAESTRLAKGNFYKQQMKV